MEIKGKSALITGGAGGIGLGIARALQLQGARIIIADVDISELERANGSLGGQAQTVRLDVTDRDAWERLRAELAAGPGEPDILVNNAGIGPDGHMLDETTPESFDRIVGINLVSIYNGVRCFVPGMRSRGSGHVVNTASMAGVVPYGRLAPYTACKFAVVGLSEAMRQELRKTGIGVTVLCPGPVRTRLAQTTRNAGSDVVGAPPADNAMEPDLVGELTVTAIRENNLYAFTHKTYLSDIEARARRIEASCAIAPG